jgi:hypothetical protein
LRTTQRYGAASPAASCGATLTPANCGAAPGPPRQGNMAFRPAARCARHSAPGCRALPRYG